VPRIKIHGAIPQAPHTFSWSGDYLFTFTLPPVPLQLLQFQTELQQFLKYGDFQEHSRVQQGSTALSWNLRIQSLIKELVLSGDIHVQDL
jgi:hypothetical protein